ncbi:DNA methyltransferase [Ruminococcus sp.]|uniref:DNA methyltransferase n=1 Tax=Ruminococcus sp. TaxID=41978 RepID=UPI002583CD48|nr:DNA methyltransferase [Ruminococcus sp.]MCR5020104.1 methylase [Ruminococcus sp.]
MTEKEQKKAAKEFAERWKGRGYEKGESNLFWIDLLTHVYGVDNIAEFISFEDQVHLDHTSFIDGYIKSTHVMIEQKSIGKDLRKAIKQSDGSLLNPFQQAKRYVTELPLSQHPRWIVTCNFEEFLVYDMEKPNGEPEQIFLKDLAKDYYRLQFLVETGSEMLKKEMEISLKAGELVGKLYDAILKQYKEPDSPETLKSLNMLCVRLVFCLYAEDAGIFGKHEMFGRYLKQFQAKDIRKALIELFQVLDQKPEDRDPYMDDELAAFPYVNGGLFADENIEIPRFTDEIVDLLVNNASAGFDWSEISPTIFGAVFESTLNPETRRSGGMHYTSIENIHKVIDPLFLDELTAEFDEIMESKQVNIRKKKIEDFRDKLSTLTFLDPACGSGNFLTETYLSLRRLENKAIQALLGDEIMFADTSSASTIKVGIGQFYGIEINDFAVTVAKTALWIAESQMLHETEKIINKSLDFLPLKSYANITEGNSLRIDWESVVPKDKLSYIMGNPPFVGFTFMSKEQKDDIQILFPDVKNLDFVAGWYKKASDYIQGTNIECGFVSTNSITQGETVCRLWKHLNIIINYAYLSFIWDSEANLKAHVHCVIIGFSSYDRKEKYLYKSGIKKKVDNINYYLCDAPNVIVESRNKPLCDVPKMVYGNKPADGGHLIIEADEYDDFIKREPQAQRFIHRLLGANEFINNKWRYCLWLVDVSPAEIKKCPLVLERVRKCKQQRESSIAAGIRKFADTPTLFAQITQPEGKPYIIIPRHSSEKRKYIPFGFIEPDVKVNDAVQIIPDATLYHFAVLTSNVHMAWMRTVCGRLEMRYRYSKDIVYNNFPWCNPDEKQKALIEKTAQMILDARAKYPDCSLADLYDETTMPPELRKAHQLNDKAVMQAYGFDYKTMTESECVAELMKMYQKLTEGK